MDLVVGFRSPEALVLVSCKTVVHQASNSCCQETERLTNSKHMNRSNTHNSKKHHRPWTPSVSRSRRSARRSPRTGSWLLVGRALMRRLRFRRPRPKRRHPRRLFDRGALACLRHRLATLRDHRKRSRMPRLPTSRQFANSESAKERRHGNGVTDRPLMPKTQNRNPLKMEPSALTRSPHQRRHGNH